MIITTDIYYWSLQGMRLTQYESGDGYIPVREVERLLEEAHRRGREDARRFAQYLNKRRK